MDTFLAENTYFDKVTARRYVKALAEYEICKKVTLRGEIQEYGVFKGNSLFRLAMVREVLWSHRPRIVGFDTFSVFPDDEDKEWVEGFVSEAGQPRSLSDIRNSLRERGMSNIHLVACDLMKEDTDVSQAALVHIDVDTYACTHRLLARCLKTCRPGTVIMLDDYGRVDGASEAIEDLGVFPDMMYDTKAYMIL